MRRVLLLLFLATPLFAKSLRWSAVDVDARLDRDGNLHVVERQSIVFNGDWNGAERDFGLRPRQALDVNSIARVDGATNVPLTRGDLSVVDHWNFSREGVVRWRSRLPGDPSFDNRELTYVLDVTYHGVVSSAGNRRFLLNHDFGMPKRDGVVERFTLHLTFDPIWNLEGPLRVERRDLQPGQGVSVRQELTFNGAGTPAGALQTLPAYVPAAALLLFAAGAAFFVLRFRNDERRVGRFAPIVAKFDDEMLSMRAEAAGAAWDASVDAPEVAAVLARMTQERKVSTRVEGTTLHMRLLVDRATLDGYERELADAFFEDGQTETDTDAVRHRYRSSGFDPAATIRGGIEEQLAARAGWTESVTRFRGRTDALIIVAAAVPLAACVLTGGPDRVAAIAGFFLTLFFSAFGAGIAAQISSAITSFGKAFAGPVLMLVLAAAPLVVASLGTNAFGLHAPVLFALALWALAWMKLVFDTLRIRDTPDKIAFRKRIAGARQFFIEQLRLPRPALHDDWFPYVLAFGLGTNVDRWFHAHGASTSNTSSSTGSWSSSSLSSSTSGGSASSWTGGGGAYGGAGATGSWTAAAGAMAAGVSAPSSSSGGGGGGGSSSGGGGGGGW